MQITKLPLSKKKKKKLHTHPTTSPCKHSVIIEYNVRTVNKNKLQLSATQSTFVSETRRRHLSTFSHTCGNTWYERQKHDMISNINSFAFAAPVQRLPDFPVFPQRMHQTWRPVSTAYVRYTHTRSVRGRVGWCMSQHALNKKAGKHRQHIIQLEASSSQSAFGWLEVQDL